MLGLPSIFTCVCYFEVGIDIVQRSWDASGDKWTRTSAAAQLLSSSRRPFCTAGLARSQCRRTKTSAC